MKLTMTHKKNWSAFLTCVVSYVRILPLLILSAVQKNYVILILIKSIFCIIWKLCIHTHSLYVYLCICIGLRAGSRIILSYVCEHITYIATSRRTGRLLYNNIIITQWARSLTQQLKKYHWVNLDIHQGHLFWIYSVSPNM